MRCPPYPLREYLPVGDENAIYAAPARFTREPNQTYTLYRRTVLRGISHYEPVVTTPSSDAFNAACRLFGVPCRALSAEEGTS